MTQKTASSIEAGLATQLAQFVLQVWEGMLSDSLHDDHKVMPWFQLRPNDPVCFSKEALRTITLDGGPGALADANPQPVDGEAVRQHPNRPFPTTNPLAPSENREKLLGETEAFARSQGGDD